MTALWVAVGLLACIEAVLIVLLVRMRRDEAEFRRVQQSKHGTAHAHALSLASRIEAVGARVRAVEDL